MEPVVEREIVVLAGEFFEGESAVGRRLSWHDAGHDENLLFGKELRGRGERALGATDGGGVEESAEISGGAHDGAEDRVLFFVPVFDITLIFTHGHPVAGDGRRGWGRGRDGWFGGGAGGGQSGVEEGEYDGAAAVWRGGWFHGGVAVGVRAARA